MTSMLHMAERIGRMDPRAGVSSYGQLTRAFGLLLEGQGIQCGVGDLVEIIAAGDRPVTLAEVVGFRDGRILMMPLGPAQGLGPGNWVRPLDRMPGVQVGEALLGRVLGGMGEPIDRVGSGELSLPEWRPIHGTTINPMSRQRIKRPMATGVRVLDALLTLGEGQRMGIFAGGGVGKSKLLGMIARRSEADVNVVALIGERGREVREFVERDLGPEGLARSVVVVATADQPPLIRMWGAYVATTIAEYFRDRGARVMLMMDSITRFAMARREVGLSVGEPPATKGYTPSVFASIPALLERAGMGPEGSGAITGLYTVLVEGDDMSDPVADTMRATLDGHVVLSRELAAAGYFPAVSVGQSTSRVMEEVVTPEHREAAQKIREMLAIYEEAKDLITIGAYREGNRPDLDRAVRMHRDITGFLRQTETDASDWHETLATLTALGQKARQ